jgi:hypothetical protein
VDRPCLRSRRWHIIFARTAAIYGGMALTTQKPRNCPESPAIAKNYTVQSTLPHPRAGKSRKALVVGNQMCCCKPLSVSDLQGAVRELCVLFNGPWAGGKVLSGNAFPHSGEEHEVITERKARMA